MLLIVRLGSIVIIVLDTFIMKNVLIIIKKIRLVIVFGNVLIAKKFYCGRILLQIFMNVEKNCAEIAIY
jgi:hypothetical protein